MQTQVATLAALFATTLATAASAEEPRSDISQINGVPVPVGDHNQYHYDFKRWNVSTNPLGWVIGSYGASVSYGFHPNLAVRGDLNYFQPVGDELDTKGFEVGLGLPIYLRRTYQGAFLEPGVIVRRIDFDDLGGDEAHSTSVGPQVLVGWQWMWDSGLNVAIAAGVGRNFASGDDNDATNDELFANGYLRFGYAF